MDPMGYIISFYLSKFCDLETKNRNSNINIEFGSGMSP